MPYTVALTGGIGSGKSTVARTFSQHGISIVDADVIARQVVEPGTDALQKIQQRFGHGILLADGQLNRPALRQHIFSDAEAKRWLNHLLHPLIRQETQHQLAHTTSPYVLWVIPLLVENNLQSRADRVLVVDVAPEVQLLRTMQRDDVNLQQAQHLLAAQVTREERLSYADDIIDNSGTPQEIVPQVAALHLQYMQLASSATRQD